MIDAHTHLYSDKYRNDLDLVIQRARKLLDAVIISAVDIQSLEKSLEIRRQHPDFIYVTAGVHPSKTADLTSEDCEHLWQSISRHRNQIVAVGEVGPDFHHVQDKRKQQQQLIMLEESLNRAEAWNLPLVVHAREAEAAALEVLCGGQIPIMFHCFAGSKTVALKIAAHGFYLSFSATLLFNPQLQETVPLLPPEQILTETDSPALSPKRNHPRNEPAYVETIVRRLSKLLNYDPQKAAALTAANARRFYGLTSNEKT